MSSASRKVVKGSGAAERKRKSAADEKLSVIRRSTNLKINSSDFLTAKGYNARYSIPEKTRTALDAALQGVFLDLLAEGVKAVPTGTQTLSVRTLQSVVRDDTELGKLFAPGVLWTDGTSGETRAFGMGELYTKRRDARAKRLAQAEASADAEEEALLP